MFFVKKKKKVGIKLNRKTYFYIAVNLNIYSSVANFIKKRKIYIHIL